MKVSELSKILETLNSHTPKGVGVFSISKETALDPQTLREYLSKYTDYFVQLPNEQSYQINRFGKFKGSIDDMIQHYEKELESQKPNSNWLLYLLFISAFVSLSVAFV
ncbi:hypothetical protein [Thalassotalea sp. PP2-459]|uniref:hypothetical protein n=1 Tax=Thalassotalea sp. PP2-459 TaxID=1742724 RepID=UPI000966ECB4|nr:hypothetical protein [Thalassotalea sp. PP2-459]OKY25236.1 hypothetical protein BI291_17195 [Thalassotalea sp. PP2-459]